MNMLKFSMVDSLRQKSILEYHCLSLKEEEKYENIIRMDDLFRFLMVLL